MAKNAKTGQKRTSEKPLSCGKSSSAGKSAVSSKAVTNERALSGGQVIFSLQSGTPIYVKTADICTATGKTNQWIGQLTAQGVIHKQSTNHGSLYNLFDTVRAYCEYLENRAKKEKEDTTELDLRRKQAEAKLKESKATVAELEAAEFQGKMHRSEDVQAMTADLLYYVRGSLRALAGRCATDCAASSEPAEIQKIIEREVFEILKDLSEYKYDRKRYNDLVRQRMKRIIDEDSLDAEDD